MSNSVLHQKFQRARNLHQQGQFPRARAIYEEILAIQPNQLDTLLSLGLLAGQTKDFVQAVRLLEEAIKGDPTNPGAYCNRGLALQELGRLHEALDSYNRAIALKGDYPVAFFNRGNALKDLGEWDAAVKSYDRAIEASPSMVAAHYNRGVVLQEIKDWESALASYDRTIALKADHAEAHNNRGIVLNRLNQIDAALDSFHNAINLAPDYAQARFNRALALLSLGKFDAGWIEYEWRWRSEGTASIKERRDFAQPLWLGGESIAGKTVLIYSEQGLGDTLQFCRYTKLVAALGAKVIFEVQKSLIEVLAHLEGVSQLVARGDPLPAFDCQCPLVSLPLAFRTVLETIPAPTQYIDANEASVAVWQAKLVKTARPRIGLVWSGSATHGNDRYRSIPLADWVQHLPTQFQYVCLQKDLRESDQQTLQSHPEILAFSDELSNFGETAALCECMDLVISVDTSVAHLSGALGKETWVLLSSIADWRWLRDRNDSPWYPTVRLYRQQKKGDWTSVFEHLKAGLIQKYGSA